MKEENKLRLDHLMKVNRQKMEEAKKARDKKLEEENQFLKEFERIKSEVIAPIMEDMGKQLQQYGHAYDVVLQQEAQDQEGKVRNGSIALYIFPDGKRGWRFDNIPSIIFYGIKHNKKIWIHRSTMVPAKGGAVGAIGEFFLEEITGDFVEQKIMGCLKDIFS